MKKLLIGILLLACSSSSNFEKKLLVDDFKKFKTFKIDEKNYMVENNNSKYDTKDIRRRILSAIHCELEEKELSPDESNADLIIELHILIKNKSMTVPEIHDNIESKYGYTEKEYRTINYQEGTILVELINSSTNRIIWYGLANSILNPNPDFKDQKQKITHMISELFSDL